MTIKEAREEAGLTQKEVYQILEIPVRTQQNWESGLRICPIYVEKLIVEKLLSLKEEHWLGTDYKYICPKCGGDPLDFIETMSATNDAYMEEPMNYCPNCGKRLTIIPRN